MALRFRTREQEEPEINLIPFIDVLLVVLIFLMLTATFNRVSQLQVRLPEADAVAAQPQTPPLVVAVGADGRMALGDQVLPVATVEALALALQQAAADQPNTMLVIQADAAASHQAVIGVMDAAQRVGIQQITFATQQPRGQ